MADPAGAFFDSVNLLMAGYKLIVTRSTAHATLKTHISNFTEYLTRITPTISHIYDLRDTHFQVIGQANWVLHQYESLRLWLDDSGFGPVQRRAGLYCIRQRSKPSSIRVEARPNELGALKFPRFGVTEKEVKFDALFDKLKDSYKDLESMMCDDCYCKDDQYAARTVDPGPGPGGGGTRRGGGGGRGTARRGTGLRGGYDSEEDAGETYADYLGAQDAPAQGRAPSRRQKLAQEQALQNLTERLERGIGDMLLKMGKVDEYRQRRHARRQVEALHREVLHEEALKEDFIGSQKLHRQRDEEARKLTLLQAQRRAREAPMPHPRHPEDSLHSEVGREPEEYVDELGPGRRQSGPGVHHQGRGPASRVPNPAIYIHENGPPRRTPATSGSHKQPRSHGHPSSRPQRHEHPPLRRVYEQPGPQAGSYAQPQPQPDIPLHPQPGVHMAPPPPMPPPPGPMPPFRENVDPRYRSSYSYYEDIALEDTKRHSKEHGGAFSRRRSSRKDIDGPKRWLWG